MRAPLVMGALLASWLAVGCATRATSTPVSSPQASPAPTPSVGGEAAAPGPHVFGGARPARVSLPEDYDTSGRTYPLVLLLHGYAADADNIDLYFGASERARGGRREGDGFVLVVPEGTRNTRGERFWNAAPACCDLDGSGVDDVAYLDALVAEVVAAHRVDPGRVYVIGHSNGGFMAYRLACEKPERFVTIVSVAGSTFPDAASCPAASTPVSVLQVHGTDDEIIRYAGATAPHDFLPAPYPGAEETTRRFAARLGCTGTENGRPIDFDANVGGVETRVLRHTGCAAGTDAELWTIERGGHVPRFADDGTDRMLAWLFAHRR